MVAAILAHHLIRCAIQCGLRPLAGGPVDNPGPQNPVTGSNGVTLLLGYAKWGALIACAASALVSGGLMAIGSFSNRPVRDQGSAWNGDMKSARRPHGLYLLREMATASGTMGTRHCRVTWFILGYSATGGAS